MMSGAVEICKRYAEMSGKREAAERAAGNEEAAAFESGSTITAMNLADLIARTTPPSRSYADGVRDAAAVVDAEYDLRKHHHAANKAAGNKKEARDFETMMIAHTQSAAAIRLLSQGEKA